MATFHKPKNLKYTEMAKYFDDNIRREDRNDNLLYEYVYHIVYMLACKARFFPKFEEYDSFALYAASRIYIRVLKKDNIKSILNYAKATLYPMKVDYQRETFSEILNPAFDPRINEDNLRSIFEESVQSDYYVGLEEEILDSIRELPSFIHKEVLRTPYKNDKLMCRRLYYSILLSIIKGAILPPNVFDKLLEDSEGNSNLPKILKAYKKEQKNCIIC